VFNKPDKAQGNRAALINESNHVDLPLDRSKLSADMYNNLGIDTTCFISMVTTDHYNVQCFNNKNAIQCCGHGMIAAAKNIFTETSLSKITINHNVTASRNPDDYDVIELKLPRLTATIHTVPAWTHELIRLNDKYLVADHAAVSEQNDGYLLLEIDSDISINDFSRLQVDLKKICENTQRAIVIMQFDKAKQYLWMRYFAPQYGVSEDSATGSVQRFVADYIEQRYQSKHFEVSQCSPQGGYMKVDCFPEGIQITANASLESN
jgi:PhzF family phenazine biosynthesis protein